MNDEHSSSSAVRDTRESDPTPENKPNEEVEAVDDTVSAIREKLRSLYFEEAQSVRKTKSLEFMLNGALPDGYAQESELRLRMIEIQRKLLETRLSELLAEESDSRIVEQWKANLATTRSATRAAWVAGIAAGVSCLVTGAAAWVQAHTPAPAVTVSPQVIPPHIVVSPQPPVVRVQVTPEGLVCSDRPSRSPQRQQP